MKSGLALVLAACHHAAATSPENAAPPPTALSGWVLVSQGAWLRARASESAEGGRARVLKGKPTDDENLEQVFVMRAVSAEGDWVTVENPVSDEIAPHCYGTLPLDSFRLRLHVRKSDLLPVTQHAVDVSYPDGSGFSLSAGVVVTASGDGYMIGVDNFHPTLKVPADAVGMTYAGPSPRLDRHKGDGKAWPDGAFQIDGEDISIGEASSDNTSLHGAIATLRQPCSLYRGVIVKNHFAFGGSPYGVGAGQVFSNLFDLPGVNAHAKLYWPDGTSAGETLESIEVMWTAGQHGDLSCFLVSLASGMAGGQTRPSDDASLTLCAHQADWFDGYHL